MDLENMVSLRYPALFKISKDKTMDISFRDVSDANVYDVDLDVALNVAQESLITTLIYYIANYREFPEPSKIRKNEFFIGLPKQFLQKAARCKKDRSLLGI